MRGSHAMRFACTLTLRQEKLVSADSLSEIAFDDGLFKDESYAARRSAKQGRLKLSSCAL
jgi:hypothetical protein